MKSRLFTALDGQASSVDSPGVANHVRAEERGGAGPTRKIFVADIVIPTAPDASSKKNRELYLLYREGSKSGSLPTVQIDGVHGGFVAGISAAAVIAIVIEK